MASSASAELHRIAAKLKAQGSGKQRLQLIRDLRAGAQPLVPAVKEAAGRQLPKAGGLNRVVAAQKVTVSVSTTARSAGVRLKQNNHDAYTTDKGEVRHPVFGSTNNQRWVQQSIPQASGWWTDTLRRKSPSVTPVLVAGMRRAAAEIQA